IFDCEDTLDGLGPIVECEIEQAPMDGHEQTVTARSAKAAHGTLGAHVNVSPKRVRSSNLKHGEIERAELLANISEAVPLPGVSAIVDTVLGAAKSERRPQSLEP